MPLAYVKESSSATFGLAVRNACGEAESIYCSWITLAVEVGALKEAVKMAQNMNLSRIIFETADSVEVVLFFPVTIPFRLNWQNN